ncbi:hypothetical protein GCM10011416_20070 [Polaribacter pacificus]|uniref:Uncharacterized protein n=1 Tax=Polaribacter pacificus TaxID=1775173 RepID=A0A917I0C2_9FLAO|nr:hypothetical protein GCM10011416_20070 [Polaribacter pacificus]
MGLKCSDDLKKIELLSSKKENLEEINLLTKKVITNFNESVIEYKRIISVL